MQSFTYNGLPTRVIFGSGTRGAMAAEAEKLGIRRALVLSTPFQAELAQEVAADLGSLAAGYFTEAAMHTPVSVTESALAALQEAGADGVVSVGGGSTTGLGKAMALRTDVPQLVLPTTYAGSEMTNILGQTEGGRKTTLRDPRVQPETVIYDVDLTLTLPPGLSGTSGINAIAHAVEALYAEDRNPVISLLAAEGVAALYRGLPVIAADARNLEARTDALYGAWLCAICLASTGVALHHKLCHVLGGSFDLPHAETHTVVLPQALAYNAPAVPDAMRQLARAMDTKTPAAALYDLAVAMGADTSLEALGMPESGIESAVDITLENPYWNPRELARGPIRDTLQAAWRGDRPEV